MSFYIGLMSGTSLDGVDGVLTSIPDDYEGGEIGIETTAHVPFDSQLREELMSLQLAGHNEIEKEALAANRLAILYAECVYALLQKKGISAEEVTAIGSHGQTIRHRPELGFTRQTNNPALLAELTRINVIADFRSRDIAANGQGAPLVPAFHYAVFGSQYSSRAVINIGGIANISILNPDGSVSGFDTGPGNMLMDAWIGKHLQKNYDEDGKWGKSGKCSKELLKALLKEPFFMQMPPKSTGRDLFNLNWLEARFSESESFERLEAADVQATLTALTAETITNAIRDHAMHADEIYICGGGAKNPFLMKLIGDLLRKKNNHAVLRTSDALGVDPMHVEALAFAWLSHRFMTGKPGNLPSVTGARGFRPLGALYPA